MNPERVSNICRTRYDARVGPGTRSEFTALFADVVRAGVESGEVAPEDAVAVQGLITAISLGLAFLAPEVRIELLGDLVDASLRLVRGELLRPDAR